MAWNDDQRDTEDADRIERHITQLLSALREVPYPLIIRIHDAFVAIRHELEHLRTRSAVTFGATGDAELDDMFCQILNRVTDYETAVWQRMMPEATAPDVYRNDPAAMLLAQTEQRGMVIDTFDTRFALRLRRREERDGWQGEREQAGREQTEEQKGEEWKS